MSDGPVVGPTGSKPGVKPVSKPVKTAEEIAAEQLAAHEQHHSIVQKMREMLAHARAKAAEWARTRGGRLGR